MSPYFTGSPTKNGSFCNSSNLNFSTHLPLAYIIIPLCFCLQSFNEQIKLSKANFTKAKELIPVIEELIKGANVTAREGQDIVFMAKGSANESISLITKAEKNVSETKKASNDVFCISERVISFHFLLYSIFIFDCLSASGVILGTLRNQDENGNGK